MWQQRADGHFGSRQPQTRSCATPTRSGGPVEACRGVTCPRILANPAALPNSEWEGARYRASNRVHHHHHHHGHNNAVILKSNGVILKNQNFGIRIGR